MGGRIDDIEVVPSDPRIIYVATAAEYGFYKVSFRVPGANTGTP